jgi:hypothetical protein
VRTRASRKKSDSMDLLLDTICNTFGGVLFIAILVVMLVQSSPATSETTQRVQDPVHLEQFSQLTDELSQLADELQRLQDAREGQQRTMSALAPEAMQALLADRRDREQTTARLRAEQARLESLIAALGTAIASIQTQSVQSQASLEKTLADVERLKRELATAKASRVKELRTPIARRPSLTREAAFVLQYGRLYLWHRYDAAGNRQGLNTDDFLVLKRTNDGVETTPRPTRGIPLIDSPQTRAALSEAFRRFRRERHHLTFAVRPDSYAEFQIARNAAIDLGFEYRLMPLEEGGSVRDRGGTGGVVQ